MINKRYCYYQPNKKDIKDKQPDCSIRALTKFFDIDWVTAFDKLVVYARETQTILNSIDNIKLLMEREGHPYTAIYKDRKTVLDFASTHKEGKYICYVKSGYGTHLVAVEAGRYYDTWDCGRKLVYGYWEEGAKT